MSTKTKKRKSDKLLKYNTVNKIQQKSVVQSTGSIRAPRIGTLVCTWIKLDYLRWAEKRI